jgi:hypothetical protein
MIEAGGWTSEKNEDVALLFDIGRAKLSRRPGGDQRGDRTGWRVLLTARRRIRKQRGGGGCSRGPIGGWWRREGEGATIWARGAATRPSITAGIHQQCPARPFSDAMDACPSSRCMAPSPRSVWMASGVPEWSREVAGRDGRWYSLLRPIRR